MKRPSLSRLGRAAVTAPITGVVVGLALAGSMLASPGSLAGAAGASAPAPADPGSPGVLGPADLLGADVPDRGERLPITVPVAATREQRSAAARLSADNRLRISYGIYGFATTIVPYRDGYVMTGLSKDNVKAARQFLARFANVIGIPADQLRATRLVRVFKVGRGAIVVLNQPQPVAYGGSISIGVREGNIVSYSGGPVALSEPQEGTSATEAEQEVSLADAVRTAVEEAETAPTPAARGDVRLQADGQIRNWSTFDVAGAGTTIARPSVIPVSGGTRLGYEVITVDAIGDEGWSVTVDGATGEVLSKVGLADHADDDRRRDNPQWSAFDYAPPLDRSSDDTRSQWCWIAGPGCDEALKPFAAGNPAWDLRKDTTLPEWTTAGNNSIAVDWRDRSIFDSEPVTPDLLLASSPSRSYQPAWHNSWHTSGCNPAELEGQGGDLAAAQVNLFAQHNRMHDWTYGLGFTERSWNMQTDNFGMGGTGGDALLGRALAAAREGERNNANMLALPEGVAPQTNMYLWQPAAASFYGGCVDGSYDTNVITHEYVHAVTNRMVAGPDVGITSGQGGSMGEAWSDLAAAEMADELGLLPRGLSTWVMAPYVTGNTTTGIRNYRADRATLQYGELGYDRGFAVHSAGEFWSALQFDLRNVYVARYGEGTAQQKLDCARGRMPLAKCPGGRQWMRAAFDSWLLTGDGLSLTMADSRDMQLAVDKLRTGGINQRAMWQAFAKRGLGVEATGAGGICFFGCNGLAYQPDYRSPYGSSSAVTLRATGDDKALTGAGLYVGSWTGIAAPDPDIVEGEEQQPVSPVLDTLPGSQTIKPTDRFSPGTYRGFVTAPGYGYRPVTFQVKGDGKPVAVKVTLERNLASASQGATIDGPESDAPAAHLIDDDQTTPWADASEYRGQQLTVRLAGPGVPTVRRLSLSAVGPRYSGVRQFRVWSCVAEGEVDCTDASDYDVAFTSAKAAFDAGVPRPLVTDQGMRDFAIPATRATHLRLEVLQTQCTGNPAYAGEQDEDPATVTDCVASGESDGKGASLAEFQAYAR